MDKMMEEIRNQVESDPEVYLTRWDPQILDLQGEPSGDWTGELEEES
jgi:hypothetical protein